MGNFVKSVNIFLSVFGLTLDCDSNVEKAAKVKIVNLNGEVVGEIINDFEDELHIINVTTPSMNLKGRILESRDLIGDTPGYTFDYVFHSNNEKEISGNIRVFISPVDESKIKIISDLKYKDKKHAKILSLKSNMNAVIFLLEQNGSNIILIESDMEPIVSTYFHYIGNAGDENYRCELEVTKLYPRATSIPVIETTYTTRVLPLDFPKNALDSWKHFILEGNILKNHHIMKDSYQISEDHRGNILDVMNYARRKNIGFLEKIKEAEETLTIGDLHIFQNLMALTYHDFTPEERIAFFGSNYCKRKDTPIFSERGDLVLPGFRGKAKKEYN